MSIAEVVFWISELLVLYVPRVFTKEDVIDPADVLDSIGVEYYSWRAPPDPSGIFTTWLLRDDKGVFKVCSNF